MRQRANAVLVVARLHKREHCMVMNQFIAQNTNDMFIIVQESTESSKLHHGQTIVGLSYQHLLADPPTAVQSQFD